MAVDTSLLTDYTWDQVKLAAKHAMVSAAVGGGTLTIAGRTIGRISIAEARSLYEMASEQARVEGSDVNGLIALVERGERA
jgi:hypothetical protein